MLDRTKGATDFVQYMYRTYPEADFYNENSITVDGKPVIALYFDISKMGEDAFDTILSLDEEVIDKSLHFAIRGPRDNIFIVYCNDDEDWDELDESYMRESVDLSNAVTLPNGKYFVLWGDDSVDAISFNSMQDVCDYVTEICRGICEEQYNEAVKNPDVYDEDDRRTYKEGMDILKPGYTSKLLDLQPWWELVLVWCWLKCINISGNLEGELWGSGLVH